MKENIEEYAWQKILVKALSDGNYELVSSEENKNNFGRHNRRLYSRCKFSQYFDSKVDLLVIE